MDDFRAIVKTFQMLDDPSSRHISNLACLHLSCANLNEVTAGKIREFINDHLRPASFENTGQPLGQKQVVLLLSLERVVARASQGQAHVAQDGAHTVPFSPAVRASVGGYAEPMRAPSLVARTPLVPGATTPVTNGYHTANNTYQPQPQSWRTLPPGSPAPARTLPTISQLERIHHSGGESAVRGLLSIDRPEPTNWWGQQPLHMQSDETQETEFARRDAEGWYGGVWEAAQWAGKGEPMGELGGGGVGKQ